MDYIETEKFLNIFFPNVLSDVVLKYCTYEIVEYKSSIVMLDDVMINIHIQMPNVNTRLYVYALNYNILRIRKGMAGLMYGK